MIFSKKNWSSNDALTVNELNRIESGIEEAITKTEQGEGSEYVQSGNVAVAANDWTTGGSDDEHYWYCSKPITFSKTFSEIPRVFATAQTGQGFRVFVTPSGISKTGVTLCCYRGKTSTATQNKVATTFSFIACGKI